MANFIKNEFFAFSRCHFTQYIRVISIEGQRAPMNATKKRMFGSHEQCYVTSAIFRIIGTNISFTGHEAGKIRCSFVLSSRTSAPILSSFNNDVRPLLSAILCSLIKFSICPRLQ